MTLELIKASVGLAAILWVFVLIVRAHLESQAEVSRRRRRMLCVLAALMCVVGCDHFPRQPKPRNTQRLCRGCGGSGLRVDPWDKYYPANFCTFCGGSGRR